MTENIDHLEFRPCYMLLPALTRDRIFWTFREFLAAVGALIIGAVLAFGGVSAAIGTAFGTAGTILSGILLINLPPALVSLHAYRQTADRKAEFYAGFAVLTAPEGDALYDPEAHQLRHGHYHRGKFHH